MNFILKLIKVLINAFPHCASKIFFDFINFFFFFFYSFASQFSLEFLFGIALLLSGTPFLWLIFFWSFFWWWTSGLLGKFMLLLLPLLPRLLPSLLLLRLRLRLLWLLLLWLLLLLHFRTIRTCSGSL